jgi:hypothetical protein
LPRSQAIDAVRTGTCPATDQRGVTRPQDGNLDGRAVCDIGAFELQLPPPATCVLSSSGTDAAGWQFIRITAQDKASGLQSIRVAHVSNATVQVPTFPIGTPSPVAAVATKQNQTLPTHVTLQVTNVAGRTTTCDPVLVTVGRAPGELHS